MSSPTCCKYSDWIVNQTSRFDALYCTVRCPDFLNMTMLPFRFLRNLLLLSCMAATALSQTKPRARDLGVPFDGTPGMFNAITDIKGVEVGHTTLISGNGKLKVGEGPVRTGVTAILPRGKQSKDAVFGGWFTMNGNGEMTGTTWLEDSGFLDGPIMITNTHSVGVVRDAVIAWKVKHGEPDRVLTGDVGIPLSKPAMQSADRKYRVALSRHHLNDSRWNE